RARARRGGRRLPQRRVPHLQAALRRVGPSRPARGGGVGRTFLSEPPRGGGDGGEPQRAEPHGHGRAAEGLLPARSSAAAGDGEGGGRRAGGVNRPQWPRSSALPSGLRTPAPPS